MKCVMCGSEDIPMVGDSYASRRQIPILKNCKIIGRIRIAYPKDIPLCFKCRAEVIGK
jgi:hypothetical protein